MGTQTTPQNSALLRRDFLKGSALALIPAAVTSCQTSAPSSAAPAALPDWAQNLVTSFNQFKDHPVVQAVIPICQGYGIISNFAFQMNVMDSLNRINSKLAEIDQKVTAVLQMVSALPNIIQRKIDQNTKNVLMSEIKACRLAAQNITQKPEYFVDKKYDHKRLSSADKAQLMQMGLHALTKGYQLAEWGEDAAVGVAFGHSTYLYITEITGASFVLPSVAKGSVLKIYQGIQENLARQRPSLVNQANALQAFHDNLPKTIYLGSNSAPDILGNYRYAAIQIEGPIGEQYTDKNFRYVEKLFFPREWKSAPHINEIDLLKNIRRPGENVSDIIAVEARKRLNKHLETTIVAGRRAYDLVMLVRVTNAMTELAERGTPASLGFNPPLKNLKIKDFA